MYKTYVKRLLDIVLAFFTIIIFCWLYGLIALLVWIKLGSPVIFKQDRPGKDEKIFKLYKFRSMSDIRDEKGELFPDSVRLTKFGKLLRASSLDELPEVWNILMGDMSIVGPRPWTVHYLQFFTPEEHKRHLVRPGLTGLAQVNGRTAVNWDERLKFDLDYVENVSFGLDIKIILLTVKKVFMHSDVVAAEHQGNFDDYRRKQWEEGTVPRP